MTAVELWVCNFQGTFVFTGFKNKDDNCFFPGKGKIVDFKTVIDDID